jgi:hypothetical protein
MLSGRNATSTTRLAVAEALLNARLKHVSSAVRVAVDNVEFKVDGNPGLVYLRPFEDDEELVIASYLASLSLAGFPLGYAQTQELLVALALELGVHECFTASSRFMDGLTKRTGNIISARKASALDAAPINYIFGVFGGPCYQAYPTQKGPYIKLT